MKRDELKKILKPLIKECIKEVIFEEGVLSTLVSEAVIGVSQTSQLLESKSNNNRSIREEANTQKRTNIDTSRKKLLDVIGKDAYNGVNIFENTSPLSDVGSPGSPPATSGPLSHVPPGDPGVDLSQLPGARNWALLMGK